MNLSALAVYCLTELLADSEAGNPLRGDMQRLVGLRVATGSRFAISGLKRSESYEGNFLSACNGFDDGVHHLIDYLLCIFLCRAGVFCDDVDQFCFIQGSCTPQVTTLTHVIPGTPASDQKLPHIYPVPFLLQ